jgi:hypothetical protein
MKSILRPGAATRSSQPKAKRMPAETIQNAAAIPISRSTFADGMPLISQNNADWHATSPHPRHYKNEQEPFKEKSEQIKAHAVRIRRRVQMICKTLSIERPTAQHGEYENRVDWTSGWKVTV